MSLCSSSTLSLDWSSISSSDLVARSRAYLSSRGLISVYGILTPARSMFNIADLSISRAFIFYFLITSAISTGFLSFCFFFFFVTSSRITGADCLTFFWGLVTLRLLWMIVELLDDLLLFMRPENGCSMYS